MEDCIYSSWIEDIEDEAMICRLQTAACHWVSDIGWIPIKKISESAKRRHLYMFLGIEWLQPWKIRDKQVYVGWHIPPAPEHIALALEEFQDKINEWLSVGQAHHLFEQIHPFMDGNGRIGRLMLPLLHILRKEEPVFYSRFIRENRDEYYKCFSSAKKMEKFLEKATFTGDVGDIA